MSCAILITSSLLMRINNNNSKSPLNQYFMILNFIYPDSVVLLYHKNQMLNRLERLNN